MPAPFEVSKHNADDGAVHLLVSGEVDRDTSEVLSAIIINTLRVRRIREVVIDLRRVTFLDAAGIRALLIGFHAAVEQGCRFSVASATGIVRRVLEITDLVRLLNVSTVDHSHELVDRSGPFPS